MNAEEFAERLKKCKLLTKLLGRNVQNLDDFGCTKFQEILENEKRTVGGSAIVTLSDTKQGFTVPRGKQSVWRMGYATFNL